MASLDALTLMTCSFNTPEVTATMLRSYVRQHGNGPHRVLILENSTDDGTCRLLDADAVPYVRNPDGRHAPSVDRALRLCATRYALLVDTDVVFKRPIDGALEALKRYDLTLMGSVCADRGGYKLYPRVHPWFCFIDVDAVRARGISFHDPKRAIETGSIGFFERVPITERPPEWSQRRFYDVGSTFYEDIDRAGLRIGNVDMEGTFFVHYEGTSWHGASGVGALESHHARMRAAYAAEIEAHADVRLAERFRPGFDPTGLEEPLRVGRDAA
jgi:hypothetical protein